MEFDKYGNGINDINGDRLVYCCFPDCSCDGSRLCMTENGASDRAFGQNLEGMYHRKDYVAKRAHIELIISVAREDKV